MKSTQLKNASSIVTYSKINTALLALLLILAVGVLYITLKSTTNEETFPMTTESTKQNSLEISTDVAPR